MSFARRRAQVMAVLVVAVVLVGLVIAVLAGNEGSAAAAGDIAPVSRWLFAFPVAGTGGSGRLGGPANSYPLGLPGHVTATPDGGFLIADEARILKVDGSGRISGWQWQIWPVR